MLLVTFKIYYLVVKLTSTLNIKNKTVVSPKLTLGLSVSVYIAASSSLTYELDVNSNSLNSVLNDDKILTIQKQYKNEICTQCGSKVPAFQYNVWCSVTQWHIPILAPCYRAFRMPFQTITNNYEPVYVAITTRFLNKATGCSTVLRLSCYKQAVIQSTKLMLQVALATTKSTDSKIFILIVTAKLTITNFYTRTKFATKFAITILLFIIHYY